MKKKFILGDEWIYYKFFCGERTADTILTDAIKPLTEVLLHKKIIDKWFFIRYNDPNNHIRIRFHFNDISNIGTIINLVKDAIAYYVDNDLIWKVETDTYLREIDRYGKNTMIESESIFFYDSTSCINALNLIDDDNLLFLFTLKSIDSLLTSFEYSLKDKIDFVEKLFKNYKVEFNADKHLNKQLNKKYQLLRSKLEDFMLENNNDYYSLFMLIENKQIEIEKVKNVILNNTSNLSVSLDNLMASYIHMMVNRQFRGKQRLFELLCYYFLFRYYNSIFVRIRIL